MKETPGSAQRMIKSVLEMMSEEEKGNRGVTEIVQVLGTKLSQESLAKIVAAFVILVESGEIKDVLTDAGANKYQGKSLQEELNSTGIK